MTTEMKTLQDFYRIEMNIDKAIDGSFKITQFEAFDDGGFKIQFRIVDEENMGVRFEFNAIRVQTSRAKKSYSFKSTILCSIGKPGDTKIYRTVLDAIDLIFKELGQEYTE